MDASVNNTHGVISVALPFHNLTRYHLETSWAVHQGILKLAHSLVEASISCYSHGDAPWPNPGEIIELRVLRRLFASYPQILGYLRTPCLEEFAVDFLEHENTILQTHLESLVLRSACPLRRLCLSGIPTVLPVAEILSRIPSIVHFTASISVPRAAIGVNGLISHLTVPDPHNVVVAPQLRSIIFASNDAARIDYTLYSEMVTSRWKAADYALESIALLTESGPGPDLVTLEVLDDLRKEGLDVTLLNVVETLYALPRLTFFTPLWI
jgi:hypothetical protein